MDRYTKEQMEVLEQFENNFYTAIHAGYSRNITGEKINLMETTTGLKCGNRGCTHCVLTFLRTIGEKYFDTKESMLVVEKTEPMEIPDVEIKGLDTPAEDNTIKEALTEINKATNNEDNGKKKRGRPRKEGSV